MQIGVKPIELEDRNIIMITDTKSTLEKIRWLIARLELPFRLGWAKMVIPCRDVSASRLANCSAGLPTGKPASILLAFRKAQR